MRCGGEHVSTASRQRVSIDRGTREERSERGGEQMSYADVVAFHGHSCPGAAFGFRVAEAAASRLGRHAEGNELVAVTAVADCSADAIQVITGCTTGRRNLRIEDTGIKAFTFRRADGAEVRVAGRRGSPAFRTPELQALARAVRAGTATA